MNLLLHSILLLSPVLDAGHVANLALLRCALLYLQMPTLRVIEIKGSHISLDLGTEAERLRRDFTLQVTDEYFQVTPLSNRMSGAAKSLWSCTHYVGGPEAKGETSLLLRDDEIWWRDTSLRSTVESWNHLYSEHPSGLRPWGDRSKQGTVKHCTSLAGFDSTKTLHSIALPKLSKEMSAAPWQQESA